MIFWKIYLEGDKIFPCPNRNGFSGGSNEQRNVTNYMDVVDIVKCCTKAQNTWEGLKMYERLYPIALESSYKIFITSGFHYLK